MDKDKFKEFIDYCGKKGRFSVRPLDRIYKKFGSEFIHSLPTEYKSYVVNDIKYTVIQGTGWKHSTAEPACYYRGKPEFYILGYWLPLDEWLLYCALSPEEQLLCRLKYG